MLEPAYFEALLEALSEQELGRTVLARMGERAQAVDVDIDAIWEACQIQVPAAICAQRLGGVAGVGRLSQRALA